MTSADHYFAANPRAPEHRVRVTVDAGGQVFTLASSSGVFSASRLDPGTAVLLRKACLPGESATGNLLDLGCGYGPIACTLALAAPNCRVYAVDVNTRALDLVRHNAQELEVAGRLVAMAPDDVPEDLEFSEIWSNPPIRIGKPELHALLDRWLPRLAADGAAWLVVGRHLGADSLATRLIEHGWSVTRHASQKGFRVLRIARPVRSGPVPPGEVPNSGDASARTRENA